MKRVLVAALLAAVAAGAAGCGGAAQVPRSAAAVKLHAILGAKPIWITLARVEGGKLAWLGFSPKASPPDRECLRSPCAHRPSPVAAFVDARGNRFDGWADVKPGAEPASPASVVRSMRAHESIRLAAPDRPARAEIRAARASDARLFAIFPRLPGRKQCAIPVGGMVMRTLSGTCRTTVSYPNTHGRYREAFVTFRESWGRHHSSWTLIVQLPAEKVVATELHGEVSPQMRYVATDRVTGSHLLAAAQVQVVEYSAADVRICPPYAVAIDFGPPQVPFCRNGLRAVDVDTSALTTRIKAHPERWGLVHLVGVYRDGIFRVTAQGPSQVAPNPPSPFGAPIPCPTPAGGWRLVAPTDSQRRTLDHYSTLAHHHDLVSTAFFHDGTIPVLSSVDPARTRAVLGKYWLRQLCVVRARYSRAFVNRVRARVLGLMRPMSRAARYGWVTGAGGYGVSTHGQSTISLQVLIVTPALRAFLRRQPRGIVAVESTFRPVRAQA